MRAARRCAHLAVGAGVPAAVPGVYLVPAEAAQLHPAGTQERLRRYGAAMAAGEPGSRGPGGGWRRMGRGPQPGPGGGAYFMMAAAGGGRAEEEVAPGGRGGAEEAAPGGSCGRDAAPRPLGAEAERDGPWRPPGRRPAAVSGVWGGCGERGLAERLGGRPSGAVGGVAGGKCVGMITSRWQHR